MHNQAKCCKHLKVIMDPSDVCDIIHLERVERVGVRMEPYGYGVSIMIQRLHRLHKIGTFSDRSKFTYHYLSNSYDNVDVEFLLRVIPEISYIKTLFMHYLHLMICYNLAFNLKFPTMYYFVDTFSYVEKACKLFVLHLKINVKCCLPRLHALQLFEIH